MSMPRTNIVKVDLADNLKRYERGVLLASADKAANKFGAEVYQDGKAASLTGYTVVGYFIRTGVDTITINGTVEGNKAYVVLPESCYYQDGGFTLSVKLRKSGYEQTLAIFDGVIAQTITDRIIDSAKAVPFVETVLKRSDNNVLDNSYFPKSVKNQFAATTTEWGYCLDRWISRISGIALSLTDAGLTIDSNAASNVILYQKINLPASRLLGKTFTVAVCNGDGVISCAAVTMPTSEPTTWTNIGSAAAAGNVTARVFHLGSSENGFCVSVGRKNNATGSVVIRWVALYEGSYTIDTLPTYHPKGYAAELAECQLYYVPTFGQGFGYTISSNTARLNIPIPAHMRLKPSIDKSNLTWTVRCNGSVVEVTNYSVAAHIDGMVRLTLTADSNVFANGYPISAYPSSPFGFSAVM